MTALSWRETIATAAGTLAGVGLGIAVGGLLATRLLATDPQLDVRTRGLACQRCSQRHLTVTPVEGRLSLVCDRCDWSSEVVPA